MDNRYISELEKSKIFTNISRENIIALLPCLKAKVSFFEKDQTIFHHGDLINKVGIILSGSLLIESLDFWGNSSIIKNLSKYEMFGEIYAFEKKPLETSIITNNKSTIMFLNFDKIINPCSIACGFHTTLIINLLQIFANKAFTMNKKVEILSKRTTEDKLLTYLNSLSLQKNSKSFSIPFNRQELANFLVVNRSALSKELMRLKKEQIIDYNKNSFKLLKEF
jgi:CRP-like cAMP-binding protein